MTTHKFILHIRNVGLQGLSSTVKIDLREDSLDNGIDCEVIGGNSLRDYWAEGKEIMRKVNKKEHSTKGVWKIQSCTCYLFKEQIDLVNVFICRISMNLQA